MPDEACWRELNQSIGRLNSSFESLRDEVRRVDAAYEKKFDMLSDKMNECISICETGHTRISATEQAIKDHERRIRDIEKFTGATATEKKWAFAIVAGVWSLGSYVAFEMIKTHWEAIKEALR